MKSIIIYYSVSGNTRKIALAIHKGMSELVDQCDIVAIKGSKGVPGLRMGHLLEYDLIGIGSPVWRGTITPNMMYFIHSIPSYETQFLYNECYERNFPPEERQHCFFFLTHGKWPGASVERAWKLLNGRGLTVIGWEDWYGDAFMTYAQSPWQTHGHPDDTDIKEAEEFGRQMVERSRRISEGEIDLIPKLPTGEEYLELYGQGYDPNKYEKWIKHHYGIKIDKEKCNGCGLCADHCPMDAIDLDADPPILPTCMWCTTCEMVCPVGAIDCNMEAVKKDRGETIEEMRTKAQILNKYFEEGQRKLRPEKRLRWLISAEDLWRDGYIYDITDHPRVVIPTQGWPKTKK